MAFGMTSFALTYPSVAKNRRGTIENKTRAKTIKKFIKLSLGYRKISPTDTESERK